MGATVFPLAPIFKYTSRIFTITRRHKNNININWAIITRTNIASG